MGCGLHVPVGVISNLVATGQRRASCGVFARLSRWRDSPPRFRRVQRISAGGPNVFSPSNSGALDAGNANSDGSITPITLSLSYDGDVGTDNGVSGEGDFNALQLVSVDGPNLPDGSTLAMLGAGALTLLNGRRRRKGPCKGGSAPP